MLTFVQPVIDFFESREEFGHSLLQGSDGLVHVLVDADDGVPELHVVLGLVARPDGLELPALHLVAAEKTLQVKKQSSGKKKAKRAKETCII